MSLKEEKDIKKIKKWFRRSGERNVFKQMLKEQILIDWRQLSRKYTMTHLEYDPTSLPFWDVII